MALSSGQGSERKEARPHPGAAGRVDDGGNYGTGTEGRPWGTQTFQESQHASLSHSLSNSGIEVDVQVLERIGRNLAREGDRAERGRHTNSE